MLLESQNSTLSLNLKGESPLYLATVLRKLQNIKVDFSSITAQLVKVLLRNGADPNDHSTHHVPLLSALEAKDIKTSTLLLEAGANVNATNNRGMSGLHVIFMCHDKKGKNINILQIEKECCEYFQIKQLKVKTVIGKQMGYKVMIMEQMVYYLAKGLWSLITLNMGHDNLFQFTKNIPIKNEES